jgi:hypothetical protein
MLDPPLAAGRLRAPLGTLVHPYARLGHNGPPLGTAASAARVDSNCAATKARPIPCRIGDTRPWTRRLTASLTLCPAVPRASWYASTLPFCCNCRCRVLCRPPTVHPKGGTLMNAFGFETGDFVLDRHPEAKARPVPILPLEALLERCPDHAFLRTRNFCGRNRFTASRNP